MVIFQIKKNYIFTLMSPQKDIYQKNEKPQKLQPDLSRVALLSLTGLLLLLLTLHSNTVGIHDSTTSRHMKLRKRLKVHNWWLVSHDASQALGVCKIYFLAWLEIIVSFTFCSWLFWFGLFYLSTPLICTESPIFVTTSSV